MLKITFLGTGTSQGIPLIGCDCDICTSDDPKDVRLRSSVLIESHLVTLIIDTGPDFRQQMLQTGVKKLDAALFTHAHRDHIAGLDDTRSFIFMNGKPFDIYAEERVVDDFRSIFRYAFAPEVKYPGVPEFNIHLIGMEPFSINELNITPIRGFHHQLPVLGFRIGGFSYFTDVNHIPETELKKIENSEILVIDALRTRSHISHFSLNEALGVIERVKPEKAYLTHISHEMGLHREVTKQLPPGVSLAYDGLTAECN